jgi:hypothetical protein
MACFRKIWSSGIRTPRDVVELDRLGAVESEQCPTAFVDPELASRDVPSPEAKPRAADGQLHALLVFVQLGAARVQLPGELAGAGDIRAELVCHRCHRNEKREAHHVRHTDDAGVDQRNVPGAEQDEQDDASTHENGAAAIVYGRPRRHSASDASTANARSNSDANSGDPQSRAGGGVSNRYGLARKFTDRSAVIRL